LERLNAKLHGSNFLRADDDMIWRLPLKSGGVAYLYVVLEFQSAPDKWMAGRIAAAVMLLYLHLIRETVRKRGQPDPILQAGRLPPVYPVVLYNGETPWTTHQELADLVVEVPHCGPWPWRPHFRYHVLAERQVSLNGLAGSDNAVAALFAIEQCNSVAEVANQVAHLSAILQEPEAAPLRQAFANWIRGVYAVARDLPVTAHDVDTLSGDSDMLSGLAERLRQDYQRQAQEAHTAGLNAGLTEGRTEGLSDALIWLLDKRLGPISPDVRQQIAEADADSIRTWFDRAIDAPALDQVFADRH